MPILATSQLTDCEHCGTPFRPKAEERFCCHGCQYVSQMIHEYGLDRFYELRGNEALPPVGSTVFQSQDLKWLDQLQIAAETESAADNTLAQVSVEGISCIGCVWLIEAIYKQHSGGLDIRINPREGALRLRWQSGQCSLTAFARELAKIGYRVSPENTNNENRKQSKHLINRIGLCAFFLLNTMLFTLPGYLGMAGDFFIAPLFQLLGATFATLSLFAGGSYFIGRAWRAIQQRVLHIDLPIALGLIAAYTGSMIGWAAGYSTLIYFDFVATFVFLMLVGRWLQEVAFERNRNYLKKQQFGPNQVTLIGGAKDGAKVPVTEIEAGQSYSVAPGAINPVAADLQDSAANLSLEWINGEAEPIRWPSEKILPAGAINVGLQSMHCTAREPWVDSLLAQLLERPEDSFNHHRLQSILKGYIASVLVIAFIGGAAWLVGTGQPLKAIQVLISVLIVSCPCALGIALPMCNEFATARLRRNGLFIKSADIWERLRRVKTVVFDKTGTLTMDMPRLKNREAIETLDPFAASALYLMVKNNVHPIARSLRESLLTKFSERRLQSGQTPEINEVIGEGVAFADSVYNLWSLGKADWCSDDSEQNARLAPYTVLRQNGYLVASFEFEEDVRDDALETINAFKDHKLNTALLSGDHEARVQPIAKALGLPESNTRSDCSPQNKADWILQHAPTSALMIGDGANDSLAFDQAICRGTPVVDRSILEASADFFFFGRSLRCLPQLWEVAARRRHTVTAIFTTAVAYNFIAVGLCLSGLMHPLLAAILMPLSSILTLAISWIGLGNQAAK